MIDARVVVDVLSFTDDVQAVECRIRARGRDVDRQVVADEPAAQVETAVAKTAVSLHFEVQACGLAVFLAAHIDAHHLDRRIFAEPEIHEDVGVMFVIPGRAVIFEQAQLDAGIDPEIDANLRHARAARGAVRHQQPQGLVSRKVGRYVDFDAVLEEGGIQIGEAIVTWRVVVDRQRVHRHAGKPVDGGQRVDAPAVRDNKPVRVDLADNPPNARLVVARFVVA